MTKSIKILTGILVVQLVLVFWLYSGANEMAAYRSDESLLGLDIAALDGIKVEQKDQPVLTLAKKGDKWVLPDEHDFPVLSAKFSALADKLLALKKSWPVAKTSVAAKQLRVADGDFERKITFMKGDKPQKTLYLGTAPSFRKIHARVDGDSAIFDIDFSAFEADPKKAEWYDKDLLKLDKKDLSSAALNGVTLKDTGSGLQPQGLTAAEEPNKEELDALIAALTGLAYDEVLGVEDKPEYKQAEPLLEYEIETKKGGKIAYRVSGPIDKDLYVLKTSLYPFYFKVRKDSFDKIKGVTGDKLIKAKAAQPAAAEVKAAEAPTQAESAAAAQKDAPAAH